MTTVTKEAPWVGEPHSSTNHTHNLTTQLHF